MRARTGELEPTRVVPAECGVDNDQEQLAAATGTGQPRLGLEQPEQGRWEAAGLVSGLGQCLERQRRSRRAEPEPEPEPGTGASAAPGIHTKRPLRTPRTCERLQCGRGQGILEKE